MHYSTLLYQFYAYFLLISIGVLATRFKIITNSNSSFLANYILKISFPVLIFVTFTNIELTNDVIRNISFSFLFSYIAVGILFLLGFWGSKFLSLNESSNKVFVLHSVFGNYVFIGFPFIAALFPNGEGLIYASIFQLACDSLLWTIGIVFLANKKEKEKGDSARHLLNPVTIAFFISMLLLLLGLKLPVEFEKPLRGLGHTTLYLSLVYVGYILYSINFKHLHKKASLYILSINKLLLAPVLVLIIIVLFNKYVFMALSKAALSAIVLQTAMPAMATIAILAKKYGADDNLATENIFITTIISIITLPLIWFLINYLS
jgi:predicted permease